MRPPAHQQQQHTLAVYDGCHAPAASLISRKIPGLHGTYQAPAQRAPLLAVLQGAEVAVYAATSPTFTADQPVPLLLHDCKPMTPSVSVAAGQQDGTPAAKQRVVSHHEQPCRHCALSQRHCSRA